MEIITYSSNWYSEWNAQEICAVLEYQNISMYLYCKFSILWLNERSEISRLFRQLSKIDKFNIGMSDHLEICLFWKSKNLFLQFRNTQTFKIQSELYRNHAFVYKISWKIYYEFNLGGGGSFLEFPKCNIQCAMFLDYNLPRRLCAFLRGGELVKVAITLFALCQ